MEASDRATFLIRKVFLQEEENLAGQYGWIWEDARWHELVTALMLQIVNQPEGVIRRLADDGLLRMPSAGCVRGHRRRRRRRPGDPV